MDDNFVLQNKPNVQFMLAVVFRKIDEKYARNYTRTICQSLVGVHPCNVTEISLGVNDRA